MVLPIIVYGIVTAVSIAAPIVAQYVYPPEPPKAYCQAGFQYNEATGQCEPTPEYLQMLAQQLIPPPEPTVAYIEPAKPSGGQRELFGIPVWGWGIVGVFLGGVGLLTLKKE